MIRHAPSASIVPLIYRKDQRRPELFRLASECPGLQVWLAPRNTRRLQKVILRFAVLAGLHKVSYHRVHPRLQRLVRGSLHITLERFFSAWEFLHAKMNPDDVLMISDGRDVLLQADPFNQVGNRLVTGQEEQSIRACPTNYGWICDLYGKDVARSLSLKPVLCSGVSLGRREMMRSYLSAMTQEIWRLFPRIGLRGYFDQAVHNWVIHGLGYPAEATLSEKGLIATLGLMPPSYIAWDEPRAAVRVFGKFPSIVHQYDRHPYLTEKIVAHS